ncbi:tetraspanin-33-like [Ornithodoros turicata]|uniref:tetraspanin-33-like n=1 Tax=Ornithodoros turicata TaxID=34597 RepID=UPI003139A37D
MGPRMRSSSVPDEEVNPAQRIPLIVINLVLMISSALILAICMYSLYERWNEIHWIKSSVVVSFIINLEIPFLTASLYTFFAATTGFVGAIRENTTLLLWYTYSLCVLQLLVLAFAIFIFVGPLLTRKSIEGIVSIEFVQNYRDNDDFRALIDYIQKTFECCGVTDQTFRDWNSNIYFNCSNTNPSFERCNVPASCCKTDDEENAADPMVPTAGQRYCARNVLSMNEQDAWHHVYTRSCPSAMISKARADSMYIILACAIIIVALILMANLADTVRVQIEELSRLYENYYKDIRQSLRRKMARRKSLDKAARRRRSVDLSMASEDDDVGDQDLGSFITEGMTSVNKSQL